MERAATRDASCLVARASRLQVVKKKSMDQCRAIIFAETSLDVRFDFSERQNIPRGLLGQSVPQEEPEVFEGVVDHKHLVVLEGA